MSTLCVTPNVALDRTLVVPRFAIGGVSRSESVRISIGGKGVNVARTLSSLGQPNHSAGLLGGETGALASRLADAEGLSASWTPIARPTRTCVIILADGLGASVINEPGPLISEDEWSQFIANVGILSRGRSGVCISGSVPPGSPPDAMRQLIEAARGGQSRRVWIDSSGEPLVDAVAASPFGIKVNANEASAITGQSITDVNGALNAAHTIAELGIRAVALTLGEQGAVLVYDGRAWYARAPEVAVNNPVGSGDSFLAGLIMAYRDGSSPEEALRFASACGTANTLNAEAGRIGAIEVTRLAAEVAVHPMALL
ncbi:MAG: 1-phosphofructokinase family hexose kinase [Rhodospirillales bacterium]|nr:1-phosphofructokinase family hexose kinase [Rhodospirillales bacterium]